MYEAYKDLRRFDLFDNAQLKDWQNRTGIELRKEDPHYLTRVHMRNRETREVERRYFLVSFLDAMIEISGSDVSSLYVC